MSTTKLNGANGTQKQLPNSTLNGNEKNPNGSTVKTEFVLPVKLPEPKEHDEQKPLEDRILRVQMLSDLIERREKLMESLRKLNGFKFSSDSLKDKLTISDGKNNEFSTTNSAAIKDVIETIKTSTQAKLDEVEKQIVF